MPLTGAKVWGIASDPRGNQYAALANTTTDIFGAFTLDSIPQKSDSNVNVTKIEVSALHEDEDRNETRVTEFLKLGGSGRTRLVELPLEPLFVIPALLAASILLGVVQAPDNKLLAAKFYGAACLGFLFALVMVVYIVLGLSHVSSRSLSEDSFLETKTATQ